MTLRKNQRLGPYEIIGPIGAGGMGEVFRARDTRLDRTVAIKILPLRVAETTDRLERFEREARSISRLTHPNVCTLHDIGHEDGVRFLVLEHCEGETLAARLDREGALSLRDVTRFGAQIAEAIDAAHRQGVIHRDLKPGNIMITPEGVKLLDFGLARITEAAEVVDAQAPTAAFDSKRSLTDEGIVLGTYPYMSPEQVEGNDADSRSDIFALGAVLYEMATGTRAFTGNSAASVMASVIKEDPEPISNSQPVSPPALDHVVRRCLEKDPEERWQNARDVAVQLRWISEAGSQARAAAPGSSARKTREGLGWMVAALLALVAVGAIWWASSNRETQEPTFVSIAIPDGTGLSGPALSRDGRTLAYVLIREGERSLMVRSLAEREARVLEYAENASFPFFSADGLWIAYLDIEKDELRKVPLSGGVSQVICALDRISGADWSESGEIIFSKGAPSGLWRVPASGGEPESLVDLVPSSVEEGFPFTVSFLPEDSGIIYRRWYPSGKDEVHALKWGERPVTVIDSARFLDIDESGRVLYTSGETVYAVDLDLSTLKPEKEPVGLMQGGVDGAFAGAGSVVIERLERAPRAIEWMDPAGSRTPTPLPDGNYVNAVLSPSGAMAAVTIESSEGVDQLWVADLDRGTLSPLVVEPASVVNPVWNPDGNRIAYSLSRGAALDIFETSLDGGPPQTVLADPRELLIPSQFTPDGRKLIYMDRPVFRDDGTPIDQVDTDLRMIDLESGDTSELVGGAGNQGRGVVSPDGRLLAYVSDETGRNEIWVRSFPDLRGRRRVSLEGSSGFPAWSADGRLLFGSTSNVGEVYSVEIEPGPPIHVGPQEIAMRLNEAPRSMDGLPDLSRFLIVTDSGPNTHEMVVILDWESLLDRQ